MKSTGRNNKTSYTENILAETSLPGSALRDIEGGFALDVLSCRCLSW